VVEDTLQKSDEEKTGLFTAIFSQGRSLFTSPEREEAASPAEMGDEQQRAAVTQEFLAEAVSQYIELHIKVGIKDVIPLLIRRNTDWKAQKY